KTATTILLWNYHDDDITTGASTVELTIQNMPGKKATLHHYRIDQEYSNSYEVWKKMGSPASPTPAQYTTLEKAGQLALLNAPEKIKITNGIYKLKINLPRQAVSLIKITYE
ncbi:MAG: beta-xylosidase, partial [Bacteroidetes bacterium]|nr:beta-xylosidase [Bacteroidota bacterium]